MSPQKLRKPTMNVDMKGTELPVYMKYINGGLAGMMSACIVHPLDMIKTRMQVASKGDYKNPLDVFVKTIKNEGPLSVYKGLSASLLRQATYTTTRMGIYQTLMNNYMHLYATKPDLIANLGMGLVAGGMGAFVGTPAEVLLIRMMSDGKLPPDQRRNYKGLLHAFTTIIKEEGLLKLWTGCTATVVRAMIVNMAQLVSYTQIKALCKNKFDFSDGLKLHLTASLSSGLITSAASLPVDMAKTRIQNMKIINGVPEYKNSLDVMVKVAKSHGILGLWSGFIPYFLRIGPHTVFTFLFLENLNSLYQKLVYGKSGDSGL